MTSCDPKGQGHDLSVFEAACIISVSRQDRGMVVTDYL